MNNSELRRAYLPSELPSEEEINRGNTPPRVVPVAQRPNTQPATRQATNNRSTAENNNAANNGDKP